MRLLREHAEANVRRRPNSPQNKAAEANPPRSTATGLGRHDKCRLTPPPAFMPTSTFTRIPTLMDLKFGIMSKEHENMASEMKDDEAGRILIVCIRRKLQSNAHLLTNLRKACTRCKVRKRRCDGQKPKCRGCATHGWECQYSTIRRTRSRGRR